ncbi:MAG: uroporphyrinogen-III C-methyltransferase [Planctomycetes bacterium]|nr:uroporphyrinogen-III C-methyltransferase [Planctomycetota bacterium]
MVNREESVLPRPPSAGPGGEPRAGKVFLVGAGPGDVGLLTLKGAACLRLADTVLCDGLVNPELLRKFCPQAEVIDVSHRKGSCRWTQEQIVDLTVEKARAGRFVVRLKGGDPCLFGRGGEEARALRRAGIAFEIVPGVSSVTAVPAYAGIPVTDRDFSSSLGIYSLHRKNGFTLPDDEWKRIARGGPDTLVFLMCGSACTQVVGKLLEFGLAPATPIAIVSEGTTDRQKRVVATLDTIRSRREMVELALPALMVVGNVVRAIEEMDWFQPAACAESEGGGLSCRR